MKVSAAAAILALTLPVAFASPAAPKAAGLAARGDDKKDDKKEDVKVYDDKECVLSFFLFFALRQRLTLGRLSLVSQQQEGRLPEGWVQGVRPFDSSLRPPL